jgi:hypothetical protein
MKPILLSLPQRKPRNPFVAAARGRAAGAHGGDRQAHGRGSGRQAQQRALREEIARLKPSP